VFSDVADRLRRGRPTAGNDTPGDDPGDAHAREEDFLYIDRVLPDYDAVVRRHRVVDASPGAVYDAALAADLTRLGPVVGVLGALRAVPLRIGARLRGTAPSEPESFTFGDLQTRGTWVRLADVPDEEFVFGAVGKVWQPDIEWVELGAEELRAFDRPGYAKIVAGLSVRPYGRGRTLVTYEARTAGTDAVAERRFGRYWRLVRPFVGYILGRVLARIDADVGERRPETR
jgi:hypothetical protein